MNNIYLPNLVTIEDIYEEAPDVRSFRLVFKDPKLRDNFEFKTGQFGLYSAFGLGESTFCIASSPTRKGYIQCTFRKSGRVTGALALLIAAGIPIITRAGCVPSGRWKTVEEISARRAAGVLAWRGCQHSGKERRPWLPASGTGGRQRRTLTRTNRS